MNEKMVLNYHMREKFKIKLSSVPTHLNVIYNKQTKCKKEIINCVYHLKLLHYHIILVSTENKIKKSTL